jgi:hypothetical protein
MNYHRNWSDTALTTWGQTSENEGGNLVNGNSTANPSVKPYSASNSSYAPTQSVPGHPFGPPHAYSHAASTHNLGSSGHCMLVQPGSTSNAQPLYHPQQATPYTFQQFPNSVAPQQFAQRTSFPSHSQATPSLTHGQQQQPGSQSTPQQSRMAQQSGTSRSHPSGPIPLFSSGSGIGPENTSLSGSSNNTGGSGMVASFFTPPLSSQPFYSHLNHSYHPQPQYYLCPPTPLTIAGPAQQSTLYSSYSGNTQASSGTVGPMLRIPYTQGGPNPNSSHIPSTGVGLSGNQNQDVHTIALNLLNSVLSTRYASQRGQGKQQQLPQNQQYGISKSSSTPQTSILSRPQTTVSSSKNGARAPLLSGALLKQMETLSLEERNNLVPSISYLDESEPIGSVIEMTSGKDANILNEFSAINMPPPLPMFDSIMAANYSNEEQCVEENLTDLSISYTTSSVSNPFPNQGIRILPRPKAQKSPKRNSASQAGVKESSNSSVIEEAGSVKPAMMTLQ